MEKKEYVVFCEDDGTYWCGLNTWDKQLRKAKVFHSLKYANEVAERYKELKLRNVEVRIELVPEAATHADRIRAMSDEEMAAFFAERDLILLRKALSVFEAESLIPENALTELRKDMLEALQKPAEEG